jgi:large subunit ribosomal protein L4
LWVGGGKAFGPRPHKYVFRLPKKMRRLARKSVLSFRVKERSLLVVDDFSFNKPKTKQMVEVLQNLNLADKKITLLVSNFDDNMFYSTRNIPNLFVLPVQSATTYDLLDCEILVIQKSAVETLNTQLGN